jgi:hypothetical protein
MKATMNSDLSTKNRIFLDFDDVLFNTRDFRHDLKAILQQYGVQPEVYEETRSQAYTEAAFEKGACYNIEKHILTLKQECKNLDVVAATQDVMKFLCNLKKYVFSDVVNFLHSYSKESLYLLTFGGKDFQEKKIQGSQLMHSFGTVSITQGSKAQALKRIISSGQNYFLDDRVRYFQEIKEIQLPITTIFVNRPEGRYHDVKNMYCDFEVQNLNEAKRIITNS